MRKRKPAPKLPAPKPTPKPSPKPRPLPAPAPVPDRTIMPIPNYDAAMAQQMYQNLMDYQAQNYAAMQASQPAGFGSMAAQLQARNMLPSQNQQQNVPTLMPIQTPQSAAANQALSQAGLGGGIPSPVQQGTAQQQQAMQNYQNFLSQGAANYQAAMQQPFSPSMRPATPTPRKPSTSSFQTPRPLG